MSGSQNQLEMREAPFDRSAIAKAGSVQSTAGRSKIDQQIQNLDRLSGHQVVSMSDDELLEQLLSLTSPQENSNSTARSLLGHFGSLNHVMAAGPSALMSVPGVVAHNVHIIKLIEAVAHRMAQAQVLNREVISSWDALLVYCRTTMAHLSTEHFRILFLDHKNVLIADEVQGKGTVDHVPVYPREVMKRALDLNASALILVHNHPSGDPTPSDEDRSLTRQIAIAAHALGLSIHDHLIIGKGDEYSFRAAGLLS